MGGTGGAGGATHAVQSSDTLCEDLQHGKTLVREVIRLVGEDERPRR